MSIFLFTHDYADLSNTGHAFHHVAAFQYYLKQQKAVGKFRFR